MSRESSVGTATRFGLDGPGIESRWEARFSAPVQTGPAVQPEVKRLGRDVDHLPHLTTRLMKEWNYTSTPSLGLCGLL